MKNQLFLAAEDAVNQRKLDVTLRQFTADRLTEEQRWLIESAIGYQRQCYLQVCQTEQKIRQVIALQKTDPKRTVVRVLFGGLESLPECSAAVLVYRRQPHGVSNTVYLYIPKEGISDEF